MLVTANLAGAPKDVAVGRSYTIRDASVPRLVGKKMRVVAGPHADYIGPVVYTCCIHTDDVLADPTAHDLPFFNKQWQSCFESIGLDVIESSHETQES